MRLNRIMIFVPDLTTAKRFYCDVLGFGISVETSDAVTFTSDGCRLVAFKCARPAAPRDYTVEAQAVFVFEVPNLGEALEKLAQRDVKILHSTPGENEEGRYAAFVDPFGIVHELFEANESK
jgi:glyoxylase I family protein